MEQVWRPPRKRPLALWRLLGRWLAVATLLGWAGGCASLPTQVQRTTSRALAAPQQTELGRLVQVRRAQSGAHSDSAFRLLNTVDIALTSRLALIDSARHTLDLQYYAIHADPSTEVLLLRLREAARRGVRIRILLDDFNSVGEDAQVLRLAFIPNVEMRLFNPLPGPRNNLIGRLLTSLHDVPRIQKRMHNKLFLADNAWGITGGRNLGDRYFGSGDKQNFVDLDVLAAGRVVQEMSASFDRYWNDELAYPVEALLDPQDLDALRAPPAASLSPNPDKGASATASSVASASPALPPTVSATVLPSVSPAAAADAARPPLDLSSVSLTWAPASYVVDQPGKIGPGDDEAQAGETVIDGLLEVMRQAQREVLIVSPYFVPGQRMMAVYQELRARGVRIRVLTNSLASNDAPAAHAGYARHRPTLLAMGVEIHEMRSDPEAVAELLGGSAGSAPRQGSAGLGLGSGPGGSKSGTRSRASLHSKAVIIDGRYSIIGSMNLDLRSQLKNSEGALFIRSRALATEAIRQVDDTLDSGAYRVQLRDGRLHWLAPARGNFPDATSEPGASARLKLLVRLIGPFAPDEML